MGDANQRGFLPKMEWYHVVKGCVFKPPGFWCLKTRANLSGYTHCLDKQGWICHVKHRSWVSFALVGDKYSSTTKHYCICCFYHLSHRPLCQVQRSYPPTAAGLGVNWGRTRSPLYSQHLFELNQDEDKLSHKQRERKQNFKKNQGAIKRFLFWRARL